MNLALLYRKGCLDALIKIGVDVGEAGNYLGAAAGGAIGAATGGPLGALAGSAAGGVLGKQLLNVPVNMGLDTARRMRSQFHATRNYLNEPLGISPYIQNQNVF